MPQNANSYIIYILTKIFIEIFSETSIYYYNEVSWATKKLGSIGQFVK